MAKILIVDDSALSRRMLRGILEEGGHEVVEAQDGFMALEKFSLESPNLVTLDMTMEGMHGLEVLEEIRKLDPNARVLGASADIQKFTQQLFLEKGGKGFINKPFDLERVLTTVGNTLEGGS
jgi:two-component system, chemotaxis family, chemotaxis protein CheY